MPQSQTFNWQAPAQRVNNNALTQAEIVKTVIEVGLSAAGPFDVATFEFTDPQVPGAGYSLTSPAVFNTNTDYFYRVGTVTTDPDGGPDLGPGVYLAGSFNIVGCTAATCGAKAPGAI